MQSGLFKIYQSDIVKNLINVAGIAILLSVYNLVIVAGFDVFKVDYIALFQQVVNVGVIALVTDLGRRFISTNTGSVLNVTPDLTKKE